MKRLLALFPLLAIVACAGGSSGGSASALAVKQNPADQHLATSALLTVADFPSGWSTSKDDNSGDSEKLDAAVAKCAGIPQGLLGSPDATGGDADSPDFNSPDDTDASVSETVIIDQSSKIDQGFAALRSPKLPGCFDKLLGPYLEVEIAKDPSEKGLKVGDVTAGDLSFPAIGQDTIAKSYTVAVTADGDSATAYLSEVYVRHDNAVAELSFQDVFSPFDTDTAKSIARKAYIKLTALPDTVS